MLLAIFEGQAEDELWVQTIQSMLDKQNIKFSEDFDYFRNAQLLLGYPMRQINNEFYEE